MKQLPEKWAIRTDDPEFYEWYNKNIKPSNWRDYTNVYSNLYLYSNNPDYLCSALLREGYEEITIEQWREAVKPEQNGALGIDTILKNNATGMDNIATGELIGYEAPMDIPKWNTKKGDLWTYTKNGWYEFKDESLPAEWVETWKPRYKAKEKKRVPKSGWVIQILIKAYSASSFVNEKGEIFVFKTEADCIQWVKEKGKVGCKYTYHEVDYITEE